MLTAGWLPARRPGSGLLEVTEPAVVMRRLDVATYERELGGVGFRRLRLFEASQIVPTDRLVVSDEAVRVLDARE